MSEQKLHFLWLTIIICTCQITSSDMTVGYELSVNFCDCFCSVKNKTLNDTQMKDFCTDKVQPNTAVRGKCTKNKTVIFSINITKANNKYLVKVKETETLFNTTSQILSHFLPSSILKNLTGNSGGPYFLYVHKNDTTCVTCINPCALRDDSSSSIYPSEASCISPQPVFSPSDASKMLETLQLRIEEMERNNQSVAAVEEDGVQGLIYRQERNTKPKDIIMLHSSDQKNMSVSESLNVPETSFSWYVKISEEAFNKSQAESNRSTFVGVLRFQNLEDNDTNHIILNKEVYGISMGANISNLTDKIEIIIQQKNLAGSESCNSWSGKGKLKWTAFGCDTEIINKIKIRCSCSHLTFFAVLMAPPGTNITVTDVERLTYISNIGCGLSMFFLAIGLFMHFLLRKQKSSQATKILINMFVALFLLNLSFLCNESIANMQDRTACSISALVMHYSLLVTFTCFFIQALHMYLLLIRQNNTIQNYMRKVMVSGWVCPAPVVVIIASVGEYKLLIIRSTNNNISRVCWITNRYVHYIVNIGYYSLVFVFTAGIFIMLFTKIIEARHVKVGDVRRRTFRKQLMLILSLFLLLGLTWGAAFFSYGDMAVPSYYIFCVLNSFQGFFLFLYYYHIRNDTDTRFSEDPDGSNTNNESSTYTVTETH